MFIMKNQVSYKDKYIKYKSKYINLKKQQKQILVGSGYEFVQKMNLKELVESVADEIYPTSIAELPNGNLVICDEYLNRIYIFEKNSGPDSDSYPYKLNQEQNFFGGSGSGEGEFSNPSCIIYLHHYSLNRGCLAICDSGNNRIQIFNFDRITNRYVYKNQFGSTGSEHGEFNNPRWITEIYEGELAISDTGNHRIQVFETTTGGRYVYLTSFGSQGNADGMFDSPKGMAVLGSFERKLAICDSGNDRVQVFACNAHGSPYRFLYKFGLSGIDDGRFHHPNGIVELKNKNIAICDADNNRIQIFEKNVISDRYTLYKDKLDVSDLAPYERTRRIRGITQLSNGHILICDPVTSVQDIYIYKENDEDDEDEPFALNNISRIESNDDNDDYSLPSLDLGYNNDSNPESGVYVSLEEVIKNLGYEQRWKPIDDPIRIQYVMDGDDKLFSYKLSFSDYDTGKNLGMYWDNSIFEQLYMYKDNIILIPSDEKLQFKFYDAIKEKYDDAIDAGGLTNTVFYLLSGFLGKIDPNSNSNDYFIYDPNSGMYGLNFNSIGSNPDKLDRLLFIGVLFGLAILLRLTIDIKLDMFLLYHMIYDDFNSLTPEQISCLIKDFDPKLLYNKGYPYGCYGISKLAKEKISCSYDEEGEQIQEKKIAEEKTKTIKEFYKTNGPILGDFIEGFRRTIDVDSTKINRLTLKSFNILIYGLDINDYKVFIKYLNFKNFDNEEQIKSVKELIKENICKEKAKGNDWISIFLFVLSGRTRIPASGFPSQYPLTIELGVPERVPYDVHSCFNQMILTKSEFIKFFNAGPKQKENTMLYEYFTYTGLEAVSKLFNTV